MAIGYCTLEDLRRALREASLPGDISQDNQIAVDAITAKSDWLERTYKRHWYAPTGADILDEATAIDIPTAPKTRDDEEDIPRHGGLVHGDSEVERYRYQRNSDALLESGPRHEHRRQDYRDPKREIRISIGEYHDGHHEDTPAYTRIRLARKDVDAINSLSVLNDEGAYDDWVTSNDYNGGVGRQHRGEDYWGRVNNKGISELYLNVHSLADDIASLSKAVYVDFDYGHEGIPQNVRRAVANFAASNFVEEAAIEIPQNSTVYNVETLAGQLERKAEELLEPDAEVP